MNHTLGTCDICDQFKDDNTGIIKILPPVFTDYGGVTCFSGLVSTVKCFEDNSLVKTSVESQGNGRVLVVDGGESTRRALLGGKLASLASINGWAGIIIAGAVRDVVELKSVKMGIKALSSMPLPTIKRNEGQIDIPVFIVGTLVKPGEWIISDHDGTLVLPEKYRYKLKSD